ncbi:hypothetical protein CPB84DRAFT_1778134 [Gymnopilus junonius]|uniref:Uncharacterized protein n=1 Tax=Gymnopilus junonius TaxID=109634 RepID=A0A9P5NR76_GYMJU|nr:hypothetical protein CPB84DRAFT_1778134 [Gymnopilus junonius]
MRLQPGSSSWSELRSRTRLASLWRQHYRQHYRQKQHSSACGLTGRSPIRPSGLRAFARLGLWPPTGLARDSSNTARPAASQERARPRASQRSAWPPKETQLGLRPHRNSTRNSARPAASRSAWPPKKHSSALRPHRTSPYALRARAHSLLLSRLSYDPGYC